MNKEISNKDLQLARANKKDDFYTQLADIEVELKHYQEHFKDKIIFCNCDDPRISNFFHYFSFNFESLGIKKLITTCYKNQDKDLFSQQKTEQAIYLEYNGDTNDNKIPDPEEIGIKPLKGNGDFRSPECIALLKQADIVITNPPFSLFRQYVAQLIEYDKKFIILGSLNAITYKEIFKLIKANKIWLGASKAGVKWFEVPKHYEVATESSIKIENGKKLFSMGNVNWFTNLDISKRHEDLILYQTYEGNEADYPKYDNYDAINVDKTKDIPKDYKGAMGVPISFMDRYSPHQFEILGIANSARWIDYECLTKIKGKNIYNRILIKNKKI